ncbi:tetratricopeptide repeat protein [Streptomyces sp. NBC_01261]|uniref:AfsR/SARP family transcriptional regulator n=1 Tax=Streptomyces sp. NBC_01261 TaxID=2903802 RepID=UPI002E379B7D|nr:BTAD domain-containing putative transcriptional regulator [Streptomyces sp. NBC_01261]
MEEGLRFAVLGPVRAWRGAEEIDLGTPQRRTVLAVLLLAEGSPVPRSTLIQALWGTDGEPASALGIMRTYVHHLRRALDPGGAAATSVIRSVGDGYQLQVPADATDLGAFRQLLARADRTRHTGDVRSAAQHLREALGLWQGPALADIRSDYAQIHRHRLGELRLSAHTFRLTVDIDLGAHGEVGAELAELVAQYPFDERFRELLMLALYRSGRQAAALETYRDTRALLAEELGVDPGQALQTLYQRILRADPELHLPPTPGEPETPARPEAPVRPHPIPAQLPANLPSFVGREAELADTEGLPVDSTVVVSAIAGMAGVGKTTFAVHWARRMAHRYPDGQLYLNLRGFDPNGTPMPTEHALRFFLESLGADPHGLPHDIDTLTSRYRTLLSGRRVLVLLDNARSAAQVRPLLPGAPGCLVIVTSRSGLSGLVAVDGAVPLHLDVLSSPEARALLARRLGYRQVAAEPEAVEEIIARCARLPLALAVIAARAALRPSFHLTAIADELRASAHGLDAFQDGDDAADVRAVFSWSYRALPADAGRLLRLLALHPGPDISLPAAAGLAGLPAARTRQLLLHLTEAHLLNELVPGRYAFHDLLRVYASELAEAEDPPQEVRAARNRMFDHYLHTAYAACALASPGRPMISLPPPAEGVDVEDPHEDPAEAKAWFATELAVLLAVTEEAARHRHDVHTWQLAWSMANYLHGRGLWREEEIVHRSAMEAARRSDDPVAEAYAHRGLSTAMTGLGHFGEALSHAEQAIALFNQFSDEAVRAESYRRLNETAERSGDLETSLSAAREALALLRQATARDGGKRPRVALASALNAVGWELSQLDRHEEALVHCHEALALCEELDDHINAAHTWDSIAYAHHCLGRYAEAIAEYRNAIALDQAHGSPPWYAVGTLERLGDSYASVGDPDSARTVWTEALSTMESLGHPDAEKTSTKLRQLATP